MKNNRLRKSQKTNSHATFSTTWLVVGIVYILNKKAHYIEKKIKPENNICRDKKVV